MPKTGECLEPTRHSLLVRLKNLEDQASWDDFFKKYWRLIYTVALRAGLTETEAQDTVQETIIKVSKNIQSYEYRPDQCPFRSWLLILTRHRIIERLRKRKREEHFQSFSAEDPSRSSIEEFPHPVADLEAIWNEEWAKNLVDVASEQVRKQVDGKQFQIFNLYVVQEWPVKRVTETMKVTATQVYLAKHRIGKLMKKEMQRIASTG